MTSERVRTVDEFEIAVAVTRSGSSDVIVWMHGITVDKNEYLDFYREGESCFEKQGVSSVRFDFRGHGESSGTSLDFSIIGQNFDAQAVIEATGRWLGSGSRIHVVGTSFGAPPAIFAAARYPQLIHSVTLIAPVLSYRRTFLEPETEWAKEIFSSEGWRDLNDTGRLCFDETFCVSHRLVEEMRVIRPDIAMAELLQPIVIIHGENDSMVPYPASVEACRALPGVRFVSLANTDHGYTYEGDEAGQSDASRANKETIFRLIAENIRCR